MILVITFGSLIEISEFAKTYGNKLTYSRVISSLNKSFTYEVGPVKENDASVIEICLKYDVKIK